MGPNELAELSGRLARYLGGKLGAGVAVSRLEAISGGASRTTCRFAATAPALGAEPQRLVLRLDPPASLIETERAPEFAALRAFHGTSVPVPEPLWIEQDAAHLGSPFFIMREVGGAEASPLRLMQPPYVQHRARIGRQKWTILGAIARADAAANSLAAVLPVPAPAECWRRELDRWERVLDVDEPEPQPIQRAAIRWLRRNPPPPAQRISVVHGDYRTGNLLVSASGDIRAVLDWEMVHLGDPLEDLAWGINRVWCFAGDALRGGLLAREPAIAIWEQASGLQADPAALHWWELFNCVKGQAIWASAAKAFQAGENRDSIMAVAAWMQANAQDRATLELMGRSGAEVAQDG